MKKLVLLSTLISLVCNLSYAQTPNWIWTTGAGAFGYDEAYSVAVDASGNSYLAGYFDSFAITFGSTTIFNAGGYDIYLVKYDANGNVLWAKSEGGGGFDYAKSITVDNSGNIYLAGTFASTTLTIGSTILTNTGGHDVFLAKYDANGDALWAKSAVGIEDDRLTSIAVDVLGNTYLAGYFFSTITFGSFMLTSVGSEDLFIAKYDPNGNVLWAKSEGGSYSDVSRSIALDDSGNIYLAAIFESTTITIGSTIFTRVGLSDLLLVKYDTNGNVLWAKSAGGTGGYSLSCSVVVDNSGNAYLVGYFDSSTITFGTIILTRVGNNDVFLTKYDANGNVLWATLAGSTANEWVSSVALDVSGDVYMAGSFQSPTLTFGSTILTNTGGFDIFLAKYDADGNALWAKSAVGTEDDYANAVAVDATGNPLMAGSFNSPTITFGSTILTNEGSYDIFFTKVDNTTGINEFSNSSTISVYPNPSSTPITIELPTTPQKNTTLTIFNISGQKLIERQITEQQTVVDVSGLSQGVYFVRVADDRTVLVTKFIKSDN